MFQKLRLSFPENSSTEKIQRKNTEGGEKLTASGRVVTNEEGKPVKAYVV
jgi:hypothetical protein